jgi:c-di-GMP-binding flagellar brake protein YcgR
MAASTTVSPNPLYATARRHPRFLLSFPISLTRMGEPAQPVTHGLSLDLSCSGASAVLCSPPPVGETVRLSLQILDTPLETLAIVRHSHSTRSGFEFLDLSPTHQQQLEDRVLDMEGHSWPWRSESANPASMPGARVLRSPRRTAG